MAPKKKVSATSNRGKGGGGGRKSKTIERQREEDTSYVPRKQQEYTGRITRARAAAEKANENIHRFAAALQEDKKDLRSSGNSPAGSPIAPASSESTVGSSPEQIHRTLSIFPDERNSATEKVPKLKLINKNPAKPSVRPITPSSLVSNRSDTAAFINNIHADVHMILHGLVEHEYVQTELPDVYSPIPGLDFEDALDGLREEWTPEMLFGLYILAYFEKQWNVCDLVADTWIHEFQVAEPHIWQKNKSAYGREMKEKPFLKQGDHMIDNTKVTNFVPERLQELYLHTEPTCGARFLWADAMALCGSKLENHLDNPRLSQNMWPPDLVWNVMRTSLRLTRVRLTLKIEERDLHSWCGRYHEHTKWGQPCYRDIAADQARLKAEREEEVAAEGGGKNVSFMEVND